MPQIRFWICTFKDHVKHVAAEIGSGLGCVSEIHLASSAYRPKQVIELEKEACKYFALGPTESLWSPSSGCFSTWCSFMFLHTVTVIPFSYWPQLTVSTLTFW